MDIDTAEQALVEAQAKYALAAKAQRDGQAAVNAAMGQVAAKQQAYRDAYAAQQQAIADWGVKSTAMNQIAVDLSSAKYAYESALNLYNQAITSPGVI